jgi:hypothetical protein
LYSSDLRGHCRSLATSGGGPDDSDKPATEQQQPEEPESEVVGTASTAEIAVEQLQQESSEVDLELLKHDPSGELLNPDQRARSWEPFADLDSSEGLEVCRFGATGACMMFTCACCGIIFWVALLLLRCLVTRGCKRASSLHAWMGIIQRVPSHRSTTCQLARGQRFQATGLAINACSYHDG